MRAVAQKSGGYLSAGRVLLATDTRQSFELQLQGRDRRMLEAFRHAGYHWRDTPEMARSGTHSPVVHLIGHGGSRTHMPKRSCRGAHGGRRGG